MTARTHNAIALASLVTVAVYFPPEHLNLLTLIVGVVGTDIGALIPDLDTGGNYLWGLLPQGQRLGNSLSKVFYKHRTITHSLVGAFLVYEFFNWLLPRIFNPSFIDPHTIFVCIMIGFVSHLVADSFTVEGIPLFFPLKFNIGIPPIKSLRIQTGSWVEKFLVFPAVLIYIVWFANLNKLVLLSIFKNLV
jgi:inner membrane protein